VLATSCAPTAADAQRSRWDCVPRRGGYSRWTCRRQRAATESITSRSDTPKNRAARGQASGAAGPRLAVAVVDIHDIRNAGERSRCSCRSDLAAGLRVRTVDFGEQGRDHRRAGRHLDDADRRVLRADQRLEAFAQIERDGVARARSRRPWAAASPCRSPISGRWRI
jgi:hypothetical protein